MLRSSHFLAAGLALTLTACAAGVQSEGGRALAFDASWDRDGDGFVDRVEFAVGMDRADLYHAWDRDDVAGLDETEWYAGVGDTDLSWGSWEAWDTDRDQRIWDDEFTEGFFRMWDADGDGRLDADEMRGGMELL